MNIKCSYFQIALLSIVLTITASCHVKKEEVVNIVVPDDLPLIDLRGLYPNGAKGEISFMRSIEKIEYIQLDSYVPIRGILDFEITEDRIIVSASHGDGIHLYDRKGEYIKSITPSLGGALITDVKKGLFYNYDSEYILSFDLSDGRKKTETENALYHIPSNTHFLPFSDNFYLVSPLYNQKTEALDSLEIAVYDSTGLIIQPTLRVSPNDVRIGTTRQIIIATPIPEGYVFLPPVPYRTPTSYYTIYIATKEGIIPVFYFLIDNNMFIRNLLFMNDKLYIHFHSYRNGKEDVIVEYNTITQSIEHISIPKYLHLNKNYIPIKGVLNTIDYGCPIWGKKHYTHLNIIADAFSAKNITDFFSYDDLRKNAPEFLRNINSDENPIIIIYHLK